MSFRIALIAIGAVALAGCNTMYTHIGDEDPGIGEAVAYDAAIQTVNPAPVYSAGSPGRSRHFAVDGRERPRPGHLRERLEPEHDRELHC